MSVLLSPAETRLGVSETALLSRLTEGLPEAFWNRWHELSRLAEHRALTAEEQAERESLIPRLEDWHLTRMECLMELARLRGEDPHHLAQSLGLSLA